MEKDYAKKRAVLAYNRIILPYRNMLTILLVTFCFIQNPVQALDTGMNAYVSLSVTDEPVKNVLQRLEDQTGYKFFYLDRQVDINRKVTLTIVQAPLENALDELFANTATTYSVRGKQIVLKKIKKPDTSSLMIEVPTLHAEPRDFPSYVNTSALSARLEVTITGRVITADTGEPLPGVNIIVKGTLTGTTSDADGKYAIEIPADDAILVFSFIGYKPEEVRVGSMQVINVTLLPDIQSLNEIVVVGYGTQQRREVTGSIAKVTSDQIGSNINANPVTALQGRAAGVQMTQQGGSPGSAVRIRVRGNASINSGGEPLIVVDGIPIITSATNAGGREMSGLAEINPNDIASMEVLKDASASAIYGARAANGVILITTKKGVKGQGNIDINYQHGVNTPTNMVKFLNGQQYEEVLGQSIANRANAGMGASPNRLIPNALYGSQGYDSAWLQANPQNTDWMKQTIQDGKYREFGISASSGSDKTLLYASLNHRDEEGTLIGNSMKRTSGRINIEHAASKILTVGFNISLSYINFDEVPNNLFQRAQTNLLPIFPVYAPNDPNRYFYDYLQVDGGRNPAFLRENYKEFRKTFRTINTGFVQLTPIPGLVVRAEAAIDLQFNQTYNYNSIALFPADHFQQREGGGGKTENGKYQTTNFNFNNTIAYTREFNGIHKLTALVGMSAQDQLSVGTSLQKEGFVTDYVTIDASNYIAGQESKDQFRFSSYFGRLNYKLQDKYLAEFSIRRDGSNRFGPGNRWGTFPGGSVGWIISNEDFLNSNNVVSFLKLRASYGLSGNAEIPAYAYQSSAFLNWNTAKYANLQGLMFERIGNNELSWETTKQSNIGIDFSLFQSRIEATIDVYNKLSEDLLLDNAGSVSYGYQQSSYIENIGSLRNKGIEFSITSHNVRNGPFTWSTEFNISHNKNTVVKLNRTQQYLPPRVEVGTSLLMEDMPFGSYWLPVYAGKDPVSGTELIYEVDPVELAGTGNYVLTGKLLDVTQQVANDNRFLIKDKSPHPKFFGGLSNTFAYKSFDLDILFYYQFGNWIYDNAEKDQVYPGEGKQLRASVYDDMNDENESKYSLIYNSTFTGNSTRFLHDGSFVRLRNVQLGYTLPKALLSRIGLRSLRIYGAAQNLLTFTRYKGWDPEVFGSTSGSGSNVAPGTAGYSLPQVKTFLFGVNLGI